MTTNDKQPYVFISYKSEENDQALSFKNLLENNNISCWKAPESLTYGKPYAEELEDAIRNCSAFVLMLSKKSQHSKWTKRELVTADSFNKPLFAYCIDKSLKKHLANGIGIYFNSLQNTSESANPDDVSRFINAIKSAISNENKIKEENTTLVSIPDSPKKIFRQQLEAILELFNTSKSFGADFHAKLNTLYADAKNGFDNLSEKDRHKCNMYWQSITMTLVQVFPIFLPLGAKGEAMAPFYFPVLNTNITKMISILE